MIDQWRTTTTLIYITVSVSCIYGDSVCLADGFRSLVKVYLDVQWLSNTSCPVEVTLKYGNDLLPNLTNGSTAQAKSTRHRANSGNCTNNLTAPSSLRSPTPVLNTEPAQMASSTNKPDDAADSHQPIVTFDEWTKEKLKQEHKKPVVSSTDTGLRGARNRQISPASATARNYASRECGAKVILSNPEAENTKAILNEKEKDEYMRNPCERASNKFVIIELCETIQPRSIEFANYELFSSGPRNIILWAAERFPNGDWRLLAELTAADSRQIQQFILHANGVYVKFIKVELLSYYGSEHYCTLSVLKVLGISMVDEYEAEAEAASAAPVDNDPGGAAEGKINKTTQSTDSKSLKEKEPVKKMKEMLADGVATGDFEGDEVITNPTVIGIVDEVSGHSISKFVDVVKDKFGGGEDNSSDIVKECSVCNPITACYSCPKDGSYIYPRHFCEIFVWGSKLTTLSKRSSSRSSSAFTARRDIFSQNRIRRSRFAFLQRKTRNYPHSKLQNILWEVNLSVETPKHKETSDTKLIPTSEAAQQQRQQLQQTKNQPSQNLHSSQLIPSDVLPASSTSHKESVFMKLNKRIAALELNMSLSSEYLSELSRQYVAQTDEHQKHMKQAKKAIEEAVEAIYVRVNETLAHKVAVLRKEMNVLSNWLNSLRLTASKVTLSRMRKDKEGAAPEKCIPQHTQLHRYSPPDDGLWTTEQVVYIVITTQLTTVLILAGLNFCYQRFMAEQQLSDEKRFQIEELVNEVLQAVERNRSTMQFNASGSDSWDKQSSHVEDSCSFRSDRCRNYGSECSSSSRAMQSDDSVAEELSSSNDFRLLPSELNAITSVA